MPYRCKTHKPKRHKGTQHRYRSNRYRKNDEAYRLRSTAAWQKFRHWFKIDHPWCCDPFGWHEQDNQLVPVQHVHHIVSVRRNPDLLLDEDNCAGLCIKCHARIEAMERSGSTEHLFAKCSHSKH